MTPTPSLLDLITPLMGRGPGLRFDIDGALRLMRSNGSSVSLNWGEDNERWECMWITDGKRFYWHSDSPSNAIENVLTQVWRVLIAKQTGCKWCEAGNVAEKSPHTGTYIHRRDTLDKPCTALRCPYCGEVATFQDATNVFWCSNAHHWIPAKPHIVGQITCRGKL